MRGDEHGPEDPLPALQAELDQAAAMAPMIARSYRAYYEAFEAEGFTPSQALYLTACQGKDNPGKAP